MEENNATRGIDNPPPTLLQRLRGRAPLIVILVLVAAVVLLTGLIRGQSEDLKAKNSTEMGKTKPPANVIAMEVLADRLRDKIDLPGHVKPWVSLKVVAEVKGIIIEKCVAEGARVKKGDLLARIDARDYVNAHASARAAYTVAAANERRLQSLFEDKVATRAQLDEIEGSAATSKAAMDNAALALARCAIRAPMDGVVDRMYVEPGQFMDVATPVAQILQLDRVKIEVGIPESDVDAVRRLQRFSLTVDALGGKVFEGTRHYLQKSSESAARLYNLEIAVDNPTHAILPDMFTRVHIVKNEVTDGLAVPLYALVGKTDLQAVYVIDDSLTARLRPVEIGFQDGWRMLVRKGLVAGEKVVVVGQRGLEDGAAVTVARTVRSMEELVQ
ncbi:MAG: hypothetical protein VR64_11060 [Desulfatitalea sp. BRH_c12]|nr:MAG: hypothetical protein VR64_11060 [Desulfatitalea sp. BRH_c12]